MGLFFIIFFILLTQLFFVVLLKLNKDEIKSLLFGIMNSVQKSEIGAMGCTSLSNPTSLKPVWTCQQTEALLFSDAIEALVEHGRSAPRSLSALKNLTDAPVYVTYSIHEGRSLSYKEVSVQGHELLCCVLSSPQTTIYTQVHFNNLHILI